MNKLFVYSSRLAETLISGVISSIAGVLILKSCLDNGQSDKIAGLISFAGSFVIFAAITIFLLNSFLFYSQCQEKYFKVNFITYGIYSIASTAVLLLFRTQVSAYIVLPLRSFEPFLMHFIPNKLVNMIISIVMVHALMFLIIYLCYVVYMRKMEKLQANQN